MLLPLYVLRQLLVAFLIAAAGMLFVALPGLAVGAVHKLAGVGTLAVVRYLPLAVGVFVPYVTPVAFLLAVVATFGRLAADREWVAMQASGVNPYRLLVPVLLLGLGVGGGTYAMNAEILPRMKYQQKVFQVRALQDAVRNLNPGRTELNFGDFYLSAGRRDGQTFRDCFIEIPGVEGKEEQSILADSVRFDFDATHMIVELRDWQFVRGSGRSRIEFGEFRVPISTLVDRDERAFGRRYMTSEELLASLRDPALSERARRAGWFELHQRITSAVTCLAFVLLGVPTGLLMRSGTRMGALAVAVGYALLYWVISMRVGKQLSINGTLPVVLGAWGPVALATLAGAVMTWRVFRR